MDSQALCDMEKFIFWQFINVTQAIDARDECLTLSSGIYLDDVMEAREAFSDFYDGMISHVESLGNIKVKKK